MDVKNLLADAASGWRAKADALDRSADEGDAQASRLEATGLDARRSADLRVQAAQGRRWAVQLRDRAIYADRGELLADPDACDFDSDAERRIRADVAAAQGAALASAV